MANNRLSNALGLSAWRSVAVTLLLLQQIQRQITARPLKAQAGILDILLRSADVMQRTRQEVGLVGEIPVREGEAVTLNRQAEVVDAQGVVIRWEPGGGPWRRRRCAGRAGCWELECRRRGWGLGRWWAGDRPGGGEEGLGGGGTAVKPYWLTGSVIVVG